MNPTPQKVYSPVAAGCDTGAELLKPHPLPEMFSNTGRSIQMPAVKEEIPTELKKLYSEELGIDLDSGKDGEIFKWFLASYLMGKRIGEGIAKTTWHEFMQAGLDTPQKIHDAGWDRLVEVLDSGNYDRYDYSTASRLLEVTGSLLDEYGGSLQKLHQEAADEADLEHRLQKLKGVGEVTANIFLREMRKIWKKADPEPLDRVRKKAAQFDIDLDSMNRKTKTFMRTEAALVRMR